MEHEARRHVAATRDTIAQLEGKKLVLKVPVSRNATVRHDPPVQSEMADILKEIRKKKNKKKTRR